MYKRTTPWENGFSRTCGNERLRSTSASVQSEHSLPYLHEASREAKLAIAKKFKKKKTLLRLAWYLECSVFTERACLKSHFLMASLSGSRKYIFSTMTSHNEWDNTYFNNPTFKGKKFLPEEIAFLKEHAFPKQLKHVFNESNEVFLWTFLCYRAPDEAWWQK